MAIRKTPCSFMVTNFNGKELLEKTLTSIMEVPEKNKLVKDEIIVVDDASSDDSVEMIKRDFPNVRLLALKTNVGFQEASNQGVKFAKNRFVICLNNDMMVEKNCCEKLVAHFIKDSQVFAVSTKILMWDRKTYLAGKRYGIFENGNLILKDQNCSSLSSTLFATGGGCMIDRDKFLKIGGFDKLYKPLYWEDIDLSYRAWKRGYKILYDPSVIFYHKHQATISELMEKKAIRSLTARNSYLFVWKNIEDSHYFNQHLKSIPISLFKNLLRGETRFPISFFKALTKIAAVIKARHLEKRKAVVDDKTILSELTINNFTSNH